MVRGLLLEVSLVIPKLAMAWLIPLSIVLATVIAMEIVATGVHRYVMHGFGWSWHRSHHEPRTGLLEANDLYALVFASIRLLFFAAGTGVILPWWVGLGMSVYGALYALLHDGLVHRRLPVGKPPRKGYIKRLVQAHRLHHTSRIREGGISFGFLYAPPLKQLLAKMEARKAPR